jgi:hypothetical protein
MKCKVCGHRANTLAAMSAHYRKKHPNKMKRKSTSYARSLVKDVIAGRKTRADIEIYIRGEKVY